MCYDFRGSMNLLFFLCNVQNFILGLRINHNIILSFWPEEDIGKKYTIRNEQIFLQNIQSKIECVIFILWNIQGCSCHKKGKLHFISKLANNKGIIVLYETLFNQNIGYGEISYFFPNHSFIRANRDTKKENAKKKQMELFFYTPMIL